MVNRYQAGSVAKWRAQLAESVSGPFRRLSRGQRFWLGFSVLCLVTTVLIHNPFWRAGGEQAYKEHDVARESIISPADIYFVDEVETETLRKAAREKVKPIFAFEPKRAEEAVQNFRSAWESVQRKSKPAANSHSNSDNKADVAWPAPGGVEIGKTLDSRTFSANELEAVSRVLKENASGDIYGDQDRQFLENEISIVDRQKPMDSRQAMRPVLSMTSLSEARQNLRVGLGQISSLSPKEAEAFYAATAQLIQPSVVYDGPATEAARNVAAESVKPVSVSLKRTQKIADEGDVITPAMMSQIAAVRSYSSSTRQLNRFFGLLAMIS